MAGGAMTESSMTGDSPSRPTAIEVLTDAVVEALMARHEAELDALRLELDEALRVAALAERRLDAHPAAAVIDETFEIEVLARIALNTSEVEQVKSLARNRAPETVALLGEAGQSGSEPSREPEPPAHTDYYDPITDARTELNQLAPSASTLNHPRTVVVSRPPVTGPSASEAPIPAFVSAPDLGATSETQAQVPRSRRSVTRAGWTTRLPPRLLIQVGVVVVIVALILLKLG